MKPAARTCPAISSAAECVVRLLVSAHGIGDGQETPSLHAHTPGQNLSSSLGCMVRERRMTNCDLGSLVIDITAVLQQGAGSVGRYHDQLRSGSLGRHTDVTMCSTDQNRKHRHEGGVGRHTEVIQNNTLMQIRLASSIAASVGDETYARGS